jgi:hypothetical protein
VRTVGSIWPITISDVREPGNWRTPTSTRLLRRGGLNGFETFLNHYRGEATEKAQAREWGKVEWL